MYLTTIMLTLMRMSTTMTMTFMFKTLNSKFMVLSSYVKFFRKIVLLEAE